MRDLLWRTVRAIPKLRQRSSARDICEQAIQPPYSSGIVKQARIHQQPYFLVDTF